MRGWDTGYTDIEHGCGDNHMANTGRISLSSPLHLTIDHRPSAIDHRPLTIIPYPPQPHSSALMPRGTRFLPLNLPGVDIPGRFLYNSLDETDTTIGSFIRGHNARAH
jgi:hypothetical protein